MAIEHQKALADVFRQVVDSSVDEPTFWEKFKNFADYVPKDVAAIAFERATHYWGNFHERNLLLFKVKPNRHQLQQGKDELQLIATALDEGWSEQDLQLKLRDL